MSALNNELFYQGDYFYNLLVRRKSYYCVLKVFQKEYTNGKTLLREIGKGFSHVLQDTLAHQELKILRISDNQSNVNGMVLYVIPVHILNQARTSIAISILQLFLTALSLIYFRWQTDNTFV